MKLHLVTNNGAFLRAPTIEVDTIKLPMAHDGCWYETAVRTNGGVDDVERYQTLGEAVLGHARWANKYGCSNTVSV